MKVCGIDLAAKEKNTTGMAFIKGKRIETFSVHGDDEIVALVRRAKPDVVAVDAPLTRSTERFADRYLAKYGALSLKIPAMMALAERGLQLRSILREYEVIEVFPTATAKILGFYSRKKREMLSFFDHFEISAVRNEHEIDAIIAAYTALLYTQGKTKNVDGVIIPISPSESGPEG